MIPLHARVEAVVKIGNNLIPKGATGTIVYVMDRKGYLVEFTFPIHIVVDAGMDEIKEIKDVV